MFHFEFKRKVSTEVRNWNLRFATIAIAPQLGCSVWSHPDTENLIFGFVWKQPIKLSSRLTVLYKFIWKMR